MKKVNEDLALKVSKLISYNFLSVLISEESLTKLGNLYPSVESRKLAREWFALQVFLMVVAVSSHYKEDPVGLNIAQNFRKYVIEGLAEAGVYESEEDATEFIKPRLDIYSQDFTSKEENPLLKVAIRFHRYIDQEDALLLVNTGEQISTFLKSNMKLVEQAENIAKQ